MEVLPPGLDETETGAGCKLEDFKSVGERGEREETNKLAVLS